MIFYIECIFKWHHSLIYLFNKVSLNYTQGLFGCSNQLFSLPVKYIFSGLLAEECFSFVDQLFYILLL